MDLLKLLRVNTENRPESTRIDTGKAIQSIKSDGSTNNRFNQLLENKINENSANKNETLQKNLKDQVAEPKNDSGSLKSGKTETVPGFTKLKTAVKATKARDEKLKNFISTQNSKMPAAQEKTLLTLTKHTQKETGEKHQDAQKPYINLAKEKGTSLNENLKTLRSEEGKKPFEAKKSDSLQLYQAMIDGALRRHKAVPLNDKKTQVLHKVAEINRSLSVEKKDVVKVIVVDCRKDSTAALHVVPHKRKEAGELIKAQKVEGGQTKQDVELEWVDRSNLRVASREGELRSGSDLSKDKAQEQFLARFRQVLNKDVVKQTGIFLRDNGRGEIRLVLKPESLGNVRIKVAMENNHIAGRIIVENNSIKELFESNMANLQKAFAQGGFESTALEVSVGKEGSGKYSQTEDSGSRKAAEFEKNVPLAFIKDESIINYIA